MENKLIQKTIIQVWGAYDGGKTTTIKITREELYKKYISSSHAYVLPLSTTDINEILVCRGYKVGIESMGDYLWKGDLFNRLNNLIPDCDIVLCASRVRNDVSTRIEELATLHGYRIIKATNYRIASLPAIQNQFNKASAIHFVSLIDQIMLGTI